MVETVSYDEDDEGWLLVGCRDGLDNGYDEDGWEDGRENGSWSVVAELTATRRIYGRLYVLMVDTDGFVDCWHITLHGWEYIWLYHECIRN